MARAVMEGVALAMGKDAGLFAKLGFKPDQIFSVGGGTRNKLWNEIKAGVLGQTIRIAPEPEAGIKGCGLLGAAGAGLIDDPAATALARRAASQAIDPVAADRAAYAHAQQEFNRFYNHMLGYSK